MHNKLLLHRDKLERDENTNNVKAYKYIGIILLTIQQAR